MPGGLIDFLERRHLPLLLLVAFLFRLLLLLPGFLEVDSLSYLGAAKALRQLLASGGGGVILTQFPGGFLFWPPLYPLLVALVPLPVDISAPLISVICGTLIVLPVYFIIRDLWGKEAAILGGALAAFMPPLAYYSGIGRTETLYTLMLFLAIWQMGNILNRGKVISGLWAGLFFGLAYLSRFEGAIAGAIGGMIIILSLFKSSAAKQRILSGLLMCFGFLIIGIPYWLFISGNFGGFHVTPPTISLYNALEWRWRMTGPFTNFIYIFGLPGEKNIETLKELATSYKILPQGLDIVKWLKSYFTFLPENMASMLANFSPFFFISLVFSVPPALKKLNARYLMWFFLMAAVMSMLTFWDANPRYYGFLLPLSVIIIAPWLLEIYRRPENLSRGLLILLGAGLCLSWMFPLSDHLRPMYLDLLPTFRQLPGLFYISLYMLVFGVIVLGLLDWQAKTRMAAVIGGAGLLILFAAAVAAYYFGGRPVQAGGAGVFGMAAYSGYRSLILWIFLIAAFWEAFFRIMNSSSFLPLARHRLVIFMSCILLLLCFQNIFALRSVMERHRFLSSLPELKTRIKKITDKESVRLAAKLPWSAYQAGAEWVKFPPDMEFGEFRQMLFFEKPDFILEIRYAGEPPDYPFYSDHLNQLKRRKEVEIVSSWQKRFSSYLDGPLVIRLYRFNMPHGLVPVE